MLQGWQGQVSQGQTGVQGSGSCCTRGQDIRASLRNLTTNKLLIPVRQYEKFNAWSSAKEKISSFITFQAAISLKGNNSSLFFIYFTYFRIKMIASFYICSSLE